MSAFFYIKPTAIRRLVNLRGKRLGRSYLVWLDHFVAQRIDNDCRLLAGRKTLNRSHAEAASAIRKLGRRR